MRIHELELVAYARYENRVLAFGSDKQFHLVFGNNGAGKTTALRATSDLLFGFPERTPDAFRFPTNLLRLRGALSFGDDQTIEFIRRKGRKNTLATPGGESLPDDALQAALAGIEQPVYETMFALSHARLRAGAEALLQAGGELGEALFGASLGTASLHKVVERLQADADAVYRSQATKPLLNAELKRFEQAKREVKHTALSARAHRAAEIEIEEIRSQTAATEAELSSARADLTRWQRLEQVLPHAAQREAKLASLEPIKDARVLPADARERRLLALEARGVAQRTLDAAEEQKKMIGDEIAALVLAPELLERGEEITELQSVLGAYRSYGRDLPRVEADHDAALEDARIALAVVAPGRTLKDVDDLRPSATLRVRIGEAGEALTLSGERLRVAQQTHYEAVDEFERASAALPPQPADLPLDRAQAVLSAARQHGDLDEQARRSKDTAAERQREAEAALVALPLWEVTGDSLSELRIPSEETIARFARELDAAGEAVRGVAAEVTRNEDKLSEIQAQLTDPRAASLPTEEAIDATRAHRQEGWQLVRRVWVEGADVAVAAEFAGDRTLDEAFERSVEDADKIVDRARGHAQEVATRGNLLTERNRERERKEELTGRRAAADEELQRLEDEWASEWPQLTSVLSPGEMRGWKRDRERVLELGRHAATAAAERERISSLRDRERASLAAALSSVGVSEFDGSETFTALVSGLDAAIEDVLENRRSAAAARNALAERDTRKDTAERAVVSAETALAAAKAKWKDAIAPTGAAETASPGEVEEIVTTLEHLFKRLDEAAAFSRRVQGMRRERNEFEQSLASLVAEVAPDLEKLPPEQATPLLVKRKATVEREAVRAAELHERLQEQERGALEAAISLKQAQVELDLLCGLAGSTVERLDETERLSAERLTLETEIATLENTITLVGVGLLAELVAAAAAADADETAAGVRRRTDRVAQLEDHHTELIRESTRREAELSQGEGGSDAAEAAAAAQASRAGAERMIERYIESKLAAVLLRRAIEAYREKNQGPVLARAKELFPRLTVGRFDGLALATGGDDEPVLVGRRDSEDVPVGAMSDGERDSLYLALRIASLDHHFQSNDPMPVIVDDVLIGLDDHCVVAVLEALAELASCTQVILFTHHAHVVELAKKTLKPETLAVHDLAGGEADERVAAAA